MGNLLYWIVAILILGWIIGFVGYSAGSIIHLLLVIAVVLVIFNVLQGRGPVA